MERSNIICVNELFKLVKGSMDGMSYGITFQCDVVFMMGKGNGRD